MKDRFKESKIQNRWYAGAKTEEDKLRIKEEVCSAIGVLERLQKIVKGKQEDVLNIKSDDYDAPSWSHKVADKAGYNRALKEIETLITIEGKKV